MQATEVGVIQPGNPLFNRLKDDYLGLSTQIDSLATTSLQEIRTNNKDANSVIVGNIRTVNAFRDELYLHLRSPAFDSGEKIWMTGKINEIDGIVSTVQRFRKLKSMEDARPNNKEVKEELDAAAATAAAAAAATAAAAAAAAEAEKKLERKLKKKSEKSWEENIRFCKILGLCFALILVLKFVVPLN